MKINPAFTITSNYYRRRISDIVLDGKFHNTAIMT